MDNIPTIKGVMIMDGSPEECFDLFVDDQRVGEYNDNCRELEDIAKLMDENGVEVKVNWCATGKFGVFKARDFTTVVRNERVEGGGFLSVATKVVVDEEGLRERDGYVRSSIVLSASFMKPVEGEPGKCEFWQITKVGGLGGVANTKVAKKIQDKLVVKAPIDFLERFGEAVKRRRK